MKERKAKIKQRNNVSTFPSVTPARVTERSAMIPIAPSQSPLVGAGNNAMAASEQANGKHFNSLAALVHGLTK